MNVKTGPIDEIARARQATVETRAGWRVVTRFARTEDELRAARERVALADDTANGKLLLEGFEAGAVLQEAYALSVPEIGKSAAFNDGFVYRLRRDLFFLSTVPGGERAVAEQIDAAARVPFLLPGMSQAGTLPGSPRVLAHPSALENNGVGEIKGGGARFVTITDVTHGNAELRVVGPSASALLSKLCGLDFHAREFPNGAVKQSSLAKTVQIIARRDLGELPAYSLIGARSLAAYLWETILRAGEEFGIAPIGQDSIQTLEKQQA